MEMKEFCINMYLIIPSKYNMTMMTMVRTMI